MAVSVFDLFKIGIGPSSSHTVGPMRAAARFATALAESPYTTTARALRVELYGSLGATGKGHGTDKAVLLGLIGESPETVDPARIPAILAGLREARAITIAGVGVLAFDERDALQFFRRALPFHPNGMRFCALDAAGAELFERVYYSVGGGFVVEEAEASKAIGGDEGSDLPYPFHSGADLLEMCKASELPISALVLANEKVWRSEAEIHSRLHKIWDVMQECVRAGCRNEGVMPGGLHVRRRAPELHRSLIAQPEAGLRDPLAVLDWVNLYALAVNEENAAGGRVVTAPTNGAAGIIPAVLHYYMRFTNGASADGVVRFLLTAGAIGMLYKENASISGAEVGCQGEVGVACSMAAGALAEVLGGSPSQVENAAEIGMEHNLGLTCDPVGGLVQIPCIERNAMGSVKAINAARMALKGDGTHFVSLDRVIKTMRETGADMKLKYKETSRGGLATNVAFVPVNIIEC